MPAILEPPQVWFASATDQSRTFARRVLVTTARFLMVLILGVMAGGGWYLAKKGFGRKWRGLVVEELHEHGVEASVRRLDSRSLSRSGRAGCSHLRLQKESREHYR